MTGFVDTNVLVRHLTNDPPSQGRRATAAISSAQRLLITDVVFAECVFVLESFYETPRAQVAAAMRSLLMLPSVRVVDDALLFRALELYEDRRLDFAEAHLVASAESSGIPTVLSFDRDLRRAEGIDWREP